MAQGSMAAVDALPFIRVAGTEAERKEERAQL